MGELENKLSHYRISQAEYERICQLLGRPPEGVEWALYSALWSEHCSYKSSKVHLRKLFSKSPRVIMSFGENAGVIDLGAGEKVAFKMESHNHPSFIEPYEGAATGVGGILRDIFTMGARPIALANYLCFGEPSSHRMMTLVDGVVRGIGGYGNCVGVPTITGQTEFHKSYNKNILVNALAVGLFREGDPVLSAKASGVGNLVVYVGAKTGKDGVHGASMASESFDGKNEKKKPTIQKGDPFYEKLLIESCIEVMKKGLVVAIQDMGAAGLTSSSFEMSAGGKVGFDMYLDKVPLRDSSMTPEEILLSESQERMLVIVEPKNLAELQNVFRRWDLDAEAIGVVTKGPEVKLMWKGELLTSIDPRKIVDEAPRYERSYDRWVSRNQVSSLTYKAETSLAEGLLHILRDARATSRNWIYNQYDQRVGTKTVRDCSESVGVVRLPDSGRGLGLVLGGRPYIMRLDAHIGGIDSVAYPSLELAAKGFLPLAVTDCLNFGNPENSEIMSEFVASLEGMSGFCEKMAAPIISGNVSFYNETLGENITSTPATGVVGLRDSVDMIPKSQVTHANDDVFVIRMNGVKTYGQWGELKGWSPAFSGHLDPSQLARFVDVNRHMAIFTGVRATRVVGKFGLAYALAKMSTSELGFRIAERKDWLTEQLYEVVYIVDSMESHKFQSAFDKLSQGLGFELERIGEVISGHLRLGETCNLDLKDVHQAYTSGWEVLFAGLS